MTRLRGASIVLACGLVACQAPGSGQGVFLSSPGGAPRQVTFSPGEDFAPIWTRDGRSLIFVSDQQGSWNLWTFDLASRTPRARTTGPFQYTNPFVTHDNQWIAVASDQGSATPKWTDLWLLSLDGTREQRLISVSPSVKEFVPVISPDGRWLAYLDLPMNRPPQYRLVLVELPAGLPRVLSEDRIMFSPIRFSPDSRSILYTASVLGSADVWSIGVDGAGARALTSRPDAEFFGDYHPDGTAIVFVSNQSGNDELWTMDPRGLGARQLTFDAATASLPAYAPDGAHIAYTSTKSGNPDIWVIDTNAHRRD